MKILDAKVKVYTHDNKEAIKIDYVADIGFGEYFLYKGEDDEWYADSEKMDSENDKSLLTAVLKYFADQMNVIN